MPMIIASLLLSLYRHIDLVASDILLSFLMHWSTSAHKMGYSRPWDTLTYCSKTPPSKF